MNSVQFLSLQGFLVLITLMHSQCEKMNYDNDYLESHQTESDPNYNNPQRQNYFDQTSTVQPPSFIESLFLEKLDRKILGKISKKKFLLDAFLGLWLNILEKKKALLFKLWQKKQFKKNGSVEARFNDQGFYIPYY